MFKISKMPLYITVVHTVIYKDILLILYVMFKIIAEPLYNKVVRPVICEGMLLILYVMPSHYIGLYNNVVKDLLYLEHFTHIICNVQDLWSL